MPLASLFRMPHRSAPWLAVAAVCVTTSLTVAASPSSPVATRASASPVANTATVTAAAPAGPGITQDDDGPLSTPNPLPAAATAAPTAGQRAVTNAKPGAATRRASTTVSKPNKPSGCCAIGSLKQSAGLFEDLEYLSGSALSARLDQYVAIGAKLARFTLNWSAVQPTSASSYSWQSVDAVISGLNARGIAALPLISATPPWARSPGCATPVCPPADPNAYGTFAAAAAARYAPQGVHSWEIWNEPNNPLFWVGGANSAAYTAILKAAYARIHGVDPTATVVSGGLAPAATGNGWIAPVEFLSEIYSNGGGGSFDAVGWHPYDYPSLPGANPGGAWAEMSATSTSARSVMIANGDGAKSIWATEFGAPTCTGNSTCVSEAQQALTITNAYTLWRTYSWAGPLISYMYQDTGTDQTNREDFFGFVRYDGTQKPAYAAFRAAALA